jgi:hypothetical protein
VDARPTRADELHHLSAAEDDPRWSETFVLELTSVEATIAAYLMVTLRPSDRRTWFAACVTGRDRALVAVVEHDVPLPRRSALELRAPGLWVDIECETPFAHVSVGLEAFGLVFDSPEDSVGDGRGTRIPVGFDLEWETEEPVTWHRPDAYEMACRVSGELLVGDERFDLDVVGRRAHCWGETSSVVVDPRSTAAADPVIATVPVTLPGSGSVLRSTVVERGGTARWVHTVGTR